MFGVLLQLLKVLSDALTAGFGIFGLLTEFKDKNHRITRSGKIALIGIIASFAVSVTVVALEAKKAQDDAKAHQQELVSQSLAISQEMRVEFRYSMPYSTTSMQKFNNPLGDVVSEEKQPFLDEVDLYRSKKPCPDLAKETADLAFKASFESSYYLKPVQGLSTRFNFGDWYTFKVFGRNGQIRSVNDLPGATVLFTTITPSDVHIRVEGFRFIDMSPGVDVHGGLLSHNKKLEVYTEPEDQSTDLTETLYCYTFTGDDLRD